MGTRGLIVVKHKGKIPIAQYCQFDMYPDGHGKQILTFLKKLNKNGYWNVFKTQLNKIVDVYSQLRQLQDYGQEQLITEFFEMREQLARNFSSKVLNFVLNYQGNTIELCNDFDFGYDSLLCEWCYVIDLDTKKLDVYSSHSFNGNKPLNKDGLFYNLGPVVYGGNSYYGVQKLISFPLYGLPKSKNFVDSIYKLL